MSNVTFQPFTPSGTIQAPPSKSDVHRAVICAALSGGVCTISPVALSEDIRATIGCAQALGASVRLDGDVLTVDGSRMFENRSAVLDCRESGSTLRFFIPVAAAGGIDAVFTGSGRLPERPIGIYTDALPEKGVTCTTEGGLPLRISGRLQSGVYHIPGDVSSQFITGLLFALPLLSGDSDILLTSPVQSAGYINMTIRTMSKFGIEIDMTDKGWHIRGKQHYIPTDYTTDGDWSQAAFFLTAAAVGGEVTVNGCNIDSSQGDRRIAALLREFGAEAEQDGGTITVRRAPLHAITIDASTAALLNALGGKAEELPDGLLITGVGRLQGGFADGCNDHRIVMAAATCAANCGSTITCSDAWSINKSYPDFYEAYRRIQGSATID